MANDTPHTDSFMQAMIERHQKEMYNNLDGLGGYSGYKVGSPSSGMSTMGGLHIPDIPCISGAQDTSADWGYDLESKTIFKKGTIMDCKKELATTTKITIDAMVQAGETDEFMCTVLYMAKMMSKSPMDIYAGMTDTWNEIQDYLNADELDEDDTI